VTKGVAFHANQDFHPNQTELRTVTGTFDDVTFHLDIDNCEYASRTQGNLKKD